MGRETVIDVNNLTKQYGTTRALDGVSFQVDQGEVFGFLGPNGVGKTTTIRILTGLTVATTGSCRVLNCDVPKHVKRVHRRLGVVFEEANLYPNLSGEQNLRFFAALYGVNRSRVRKLLALYGLTSAAKRPVKAYSKGMKQRLLICRALLNDPELLILDEPTSGLDVASTEQIRSSIKQFQQAGKTVFLSTHAMEEAEELCDRVAFINKGKIVLIDSPKRLRHLFGEPVLVVEAKPKEGASVTELQQLVGEANTRMGADCHITFHIALSDASLGLKLDKIRENTRIKGIHSQEASLKEVFKRVIG